MKAEQEQSRQDAPKKLIARLPVQVLKRTEFRRHLLIPFTRACRRTGQGKAVASTGIERRGTNEEE